MSDSTRLIPLSQQDKFAIVDADDYVWLMRWKWQYRCNKWGKECAARPSNVGRQTSTVYMHRLITSAPKHTDVDHKNNDGLDNRRENLRICTHQQNMQNQKPKANTSSKYKGVWWDKRRAKWGACIGIDGKTVHLGGFINEEDAARAYDEAAVIHFGEYAKLNFP